MEARIIGLMKFDDGGEVDDKVIAVLADDKRMDHISSYEDLGAVSYTHLTLPTTLIV